MSRTDELISGTPEEQAEQLLEEILFIEGQLRDLKKLPFIATHPKNPAAQKATPAAKLYKELLQQYNNSLKLLMRMLGTDENTEDESPLRKWVNEHK